ncbi:MAG: hypothetical protein OXH65_06380 [Paracoccaceae bacterium]|nr:hypothetical protein [Paracoccaceae bacterium]
MKSAAQILHQAGLKKRRAKAAARLNRVRELREQGVSAPKILEILNAQGADWKIRTIYQDFAKLKKERQQSENAKQSDKP